MGGSNTSRHCFISCALLLVCAFAGVSASELPEGFRLEPVLGGLTDPSGLAATADGSLWITERTTGQLRRVKDGLLQPGAACQVAVETTGEAGLLGVAPHPKFTANRWVYLYYTSLATGKNKLTRYTIGADGCSDATDILADLGAGGAFLRNGGGIAFGPDGKLYVTTGDVENPANSQDGAVLQGKVLRVNDDGTTPSDNPTPGSLVYAMGVRNGRSVAVESSGQVYAVDGGDNYDSSFDEVNAVPAGGDLGWDSASGDSGGSFDDPLMSWSPVVGARAVAVYAAQAFPDLAADGLDSDHDKYGVDKLPGRARANDNGAGVCLGSVNFEQPCTSIVDCPARPGEGASCFMEDDPAEYCPGGPGTIGIGDDDCNGIDEADESFMNNLFMVSESGNEIVRAVLDPNDPSTLEVASTFMDSSFLGDCPTTWSGVVAGNDGWLYATAANGGGATGGLYRVVRDNGGGPREVSAPGSHFPLTVDRGPGAGEVTIRWEDLRSDSMQPRDNGTDPMPPEREFTVWEGTMGSFTGHNPVAGLSATTGAAVNDSLRETTFATGGGDLYFLVSGRGDNLEGTTGSDSGGTARAGYADPEVCHTVGYHSGVQGDPFSGWDLFTCGRDFNLQDENGDFHDLYDLRGKIVMMDFSARWCAPCHSEADQQEAMNLAYVDRDVVLLSVLMDDEVNGLDWSGRPSWSECRLWGSRPAAPDHTFSCWADPEPNQQSWPRYNKWSALPTNVVFDTGMRVIYSGAGFDSTTIQNKLDLLVGTTDSCLH